MTTPTSTDGTGGPLSPLRRRDGARKRQAKAVSRAGKTIGRLRLTAEVTGSWAIWCSKELCCSVCAQKGVYDERRAAEEVPGLAVVRPAS